MKTIDPRPIRLIDYTPASHLVDTVALDIALGATATRVAARYTLRRNPLAPPSSALRLDGELLTLETVTVDGRPHAALAVDDQGLTLHDVPEAPFSLEITSVCDPSANKALSGLYLSNGLFCTQCEPEGFRRIAYMLDRPDVLARYRVRLEGERAAQPVLLANGNLVEAGELPGGRHFAVWDDPHPKPAYLFALVGGDLAHIEDRFTTASGRAVTLRIYCEPDKADRCGWAMESLKASMRWDETRYGLEYDLDVFNIVAVSDFNMGAMENKGLNIFNDKLILARPDTATDDDYEGIEGVVAHEYFHNWTGNRVTCRDWFQLCLKEGLTVYRDQEFTADLRSPAVTRIENVQYLRAAQFAEDAGPLAHPVRPAQFVEINNFYTRTVYNKGAEICRMIETVLGRDAFRAGLDLYFRRHDGQAVTVEDFIAAMADASGRDLAGFMRWYEQAGTPEIGCALTRDEAADTLSLHFTQSQRATPDGVEKLPLPVPLRLGLVGPAGEDLPLLTNTALAGDLLLLSGAAATITLRQASRAVPSVLRGFSAPVKLNITLSDAELAHLLANDADPFNCWEAGQAMARRLLVAAATGNAAADAGDALHVAAIGRTLANDALEPAFRALLLALPTELEIARAIGRDVDAGAVHRARTRLRVALARAHAALLADVAERVRPAEAFAPDADQAGRRALRNAAIGLLAADEAGTALAAAAFADARNMTEAMGALGALCQRDAPETAAALAAFHDRWQDDHLVIDKWFSVQAASPALASPERMNALAAHPRFSLQVPNKVRAVIGAFALGNPSRFHAADGSGYARLRDAVLALDRFNPLMAARMLVPLESGRLQAEPAQGLARRALEAVAAQETLSRDVRELTSKMLKGDDI